VIFSLAYVIVRQILAVLVLLVRRDACARTWRNLNRDEWTRYIPELPYRNTCPR
jgi:hypothetical protein